MTAMDINQSKVSGNIKAIGNILAQGGIEDRKARGSDNHGMADVVDISEMVVLFFGDLGTWERVNSILEERAIENSPWD